jgi:transcriptional regulator with XRE-family HTH domain
MIRSLISPAKAQRKIADNTRAHRLQMGLTQEGLAERAGVALPTLRKFEQKGTIALESFIKIHMVLGSLEAILKATQVNDPVFSSIDEVLEVDSKPARQRGKRK